MNKIARVEAIPVRLPFARVGPPLHAFRRPFTGFELLLVVVETEDGIVGYGETPWGFWRPLKAIIDEFIAPLIVGRDATNIAGLMHDVQRIAYILGRYGMTVFALSGVDIALWDLAGKAAGVPLYRLLGGSKRRIPAYATAWVGKTTLEAWRADADENGSFDWRDYAPERLADDIRALVSAGYRHVKLHSTDEAVVRTVREIGGRDLGIMVDASCRWTWSEARAAALRLKQYDLYWLEEPIFPPEDYPTLARLQDETGVPIAAGENACTAFEFSAMFEARSVSVAQPNVTRVGGVTEFRKVAALAEAKGIEISPHSFLFGPGLLATVHLMAAQGRPGLLEIPAPPLEATLYDSQLEHIDGHFFEPPEGPGLGRDPDPAVLERYRIRDGER